MIKLQEPMKRGAGVLLHLSSLPSEYGIGTMGEPAYRFVDFLEAAGQKYWQVLPIGPTSYGDSPYQSPSAFAGNPYFIDLKILMEDGLLYPDEAQLEDWGNNPDDVNYGKLFEARYRVLHKAFRRSNHLGTSEYAVFCEKNAHWLEDYCLFMAVKAQFDWKQWQKWPDDIRKREPSALSGYRFQLANEMDFWRFCQFKFYQQWENLKSYANSHGIEVIGDIPIYVALDSADVWANKEQFQLDENHMPVRVAGVPPDIFSEDGQLWGNPLYDWRRMEKGGFDWWKKRMSFSAQVYDVIRIDHFIGFAHYYSIPAKDNTAQNGIWIEGPGAKLLSAINDVLCGKRIIAEDLGNVSDEVVHLMGQAGYPGMKLLQHAFDSDASNKYLPHNFESNCVVYGGTHDNETLTGFFSHQDEEVMEYARNYLGASSNADVPWALIRAGYASVSNTVIFQMQDLMGLGNSARFNIPSTLGCNWRWRLAHDMPNFDLTGKVRQLTILYGR